MPVLGDITNHALASATPGRKKAPFVVKAMRTPDLKLFLDEIKTPTDEIIVDWKHRQEEAHDFDSTAKMLETIKELKREKEILTTFGRSHFAVKLQALFRGVQVRNWMKVVQPLIVALQALARGRAARNLKRHHKAAILKIQTMARSWRLQGPYHQLKEATIKAQTMWRGFRAKTMFRIVKLASTIVATQARAYVARRSFETAVGAVTKIAATYRKHSVVRQDPRSFQRRYVQATIDRRIVDLLLDPPANTVVLAPELTQDVWVETTLEPHSQPVAIHLKQSSKGLSVFFVSTPRLQQVIAPYVIHGDVEVKLLNRQHLGQDASFIVEQNDLVNTRRGNYAAVLFRNSAACSVGVQNIISASNISDYLHSSGKILITLKNRLSSSSSANDDDFDDDVSTASCDPICPTKACDLLVSANNEEMLIVL